jgi:hypothetical protein
MKELLIKYHEILGKVMFSKIRNSPQIAQNILFEENNVGFKLDYIVLEMQQKNG